MTELDLYKFCQDKEVAWRGDKLILWIDFEDLMEFTEMVGYHEFAEGGMDVTLMEGCIALEINDLCESYDIDPERILKKEEE